jgi:hypothetical protein
MCGFTSQKCNLLGLSGIPRDVAQMQIGEGLEKRIVVLIMTDTKGYVDTAVVVTILEPIPYRVVSMYLGSRELLVYTLDALVGFNHFPLNSGRAKGLHEMV